jgi:hypothetical protein
LKAENRDPKTEIRKQKTEIGNPKKALFAIRNSPFSVFGVLISAFCFGLKFQLSAFPISAF